MTEVLVFATNIDKPKQVGKIKPLLRAVAQIENWNFDLDDCDHILRVEASGISPAYIETILNNAGFECRELE
jgi:hypothetical protein